MKVVNIYSEFLYEKVQAYKTVPSILGIIIIQIWIHNCYSAAALIAMESAVLATAIPSVCHMLVPYPDE